MQRLELHGPPAYFTPDWAAAADSVGRLAALVDHLRATTGPGVTEQTWLRALENLESLRDPARFGAWIGTTCRHEALAAYCRVLAEQRDPVAVLRTLLHEHHVRAVGVDPAFEKETGRLARAAALRRLALAGVL